MNPTPIRCLSIAAALTALVSGLPNGWGQLPGAEESYAKRLGPVVATVGDEPVYGNEVNATVGAALRGRRVARNVLPRLRAQILDQIIKRRLVASFIRREGLGVDEEAVAEEIEKVQAQLQQRDLTFEAFLRQRGLTEELLTRQVAGGLGWKKYLEGRLNDESLEAYFNGHHRHLDDSEIRVSHLLLAVDNAAAQDQVIEKCRELRESIVAKELTFAEAAEKHSIGPSRRRGGDLGFFPRHGQMVEVFSKAAFDLEKDEISPPVVTQFGVHLIHCTDIRPGDKKWTELRRKLRESLTSELLEEIAGAEMSMVNIGFTGAMPYLKPGTSQLVTPKQPTQQPVEEPGKEQEEKSENDSDE